MMDLRKCSNLHFTSAPIMAFSSPFSHFQHFIKFKYESIELAGAEFRADGVVVVRSHRSAGERRQ